MNGVGDGGCAGEEGTLSPSQVLVVFTNDTRLRFLAWLREGFRHCFALVDCGDDDWIVFDPLCDRTVVTLLRGHSGDEIIAWYEGQGLRVVATAAAKGPGRKSVIRPFTCVEAVKRLLGIHHPRVATPWQLYRFLTAEARQPRTVLDTRGK